MAKSFHEIIASGEIEVSHRGEEVTLELPTKFEGLKGILMDEQALLDWAIEHEVLHGLLHAGLQKVIIDIRAKARPTVDTKTDTSKSIVADKLEAQARIDAFEIKPTLPPGSSTPKAFAKGEESALRLSIEAMKGIGMDSVTIVDALAAKFDRAKVQAVVDSL